MMPELWTDGLELLPNVRHLRIEDDAAPYLSRRTEPEPDGKLGVKLFPLLSVLEATARLFEPITPADTDRRRSCSTSRWARPWSCCVLFGAIFRRRGGS